MEWLLKKTKERNLQRSQLHNFVRPLEAYASYVQIHDRIDDDETYVTEIAKKFLEYEQGSGETSCFRMNILPSEDNDDSDSDSDSDSWIDILVADKWEETTELYNEYLASCWLAHIGYVALEQLRRSKVLLSACVANRLDRQGNARRFSNLIRRGCREHHAGAFVYRLFLYAEVPQSERNDEISKHVKKICKNSQIMKEVRSAETKTQDAAYYRVPFLPLFVSSLRQFGDLDEVGVWKPLYKAAHFLLHERVQLKGERYVVTSNNADADQEAQEVYTWAHSLRTIAECGVNFYEVKNIIELTEKLSILKILKKLSILKILKKLSVLKILKKLFDYLQSKYKELSV